MNIPLSKLIILSYDKFPDMALDEQQMSIILTLLQFVALAVPAVAMMMQVVLRFQDQYIDDEDPFVGWEFRLIEASFLALVLGGVLIAYPIIQTLSSGIARFGIVLALLALLFLVVATGLALRRPRYPTKSYDSVEEAIIETAKKATTTFLGFLVALLGILIVEILIHHTSIIYVSSDSIIRSIITFAQILSVILFIIILLEFVSALDRFWRS